MEYIRLIDHQILIKDILTSPTGVSLMISEIILSTEDMI